MVADTRMLAGGAAPLAWRPSTPQPAELACSHCGAPVPDDLRRSATPAADPGDAGTDLPLADLQFCCAGCETVYATLHGSGLQDWYRLRDGAPVPTARATGRSFEELDDAAFLDLYSRPLPDGLRSVELYLEGVHCAACVWLVERAARDLPGLVETRLDLGRSAAQVTWDPAQVPLSAVARRFDRVGYPAHPYRGSHTAELRRKEERALLVRVGVAFAASGNVMAMAIALYAGVFDTMEPEFEAFFRRASLVATLPSLWAGSVFFRGAIGALRSRVLHMDLPVALGLGVGFVWGAVNAVLDRGDVYFESLTSLVFLLLAGRWLQLRHRRRAGDAAELLYSLAPATARLVEGGDEASSAAETVREVPVERVQVGDLLEVRAGDSVPADGVVVHGRSTVDASLLTGESRPVEVEPGTRLHAGTVNLAAAVRVRAEQTGAETRAGKLMQAVEEAARRRAPIVQVADRIVPRFVAVVLALAAVTLLVWLAIDPGQALDHAVALLIVTCPCALGLATPLAMHAALGRAARHNLLVKGGDALERLATPALVLFDKTGTLTEGRTRLLAWHGDESAKALVLAAERHSAHPVARAFVDAFAAEPVLTAGDVVQTLGGGIQARVDGHAVLVGAPAWVEAQLGRHAAASARVAELAGQALTPVVVAVDGAVVATAGFGDPLRRDAAESLRALQALGCRVGILSGDHPDVVQAVGRQLGLPAEACRGGATPEDKLAAVRAALQQGPVLMVGDGVNDAAALAAATVGIAVHGGAEASLTAADAFVARPGVGAIVELVTGARRTMAVVRRNILFSLCYNVIGAGLAMLGVLNPLIAAVMMPISSLTVVGSSFRARTFGGPGQGGR